MGDVTWMLCLWEMNLWLYSTPPLVQGVVTFPLSLPCYFYLLYHCSSIVSASATCITDAYRYHWLSKSLRKEKKVPLAIFDRILSTL